MDRDDIDGYGPEHLNLSVTEAGTYEIYVHYFSDHFRGSTDADIEIHIGGQHVATRTMRRLWCDEMWHVGTIEWNGTTGTFIPRDTVPVLQLGAAVFRKGPRPYGLDSRVGKRSRVRFCVQRSAESGFRVFVRVGLR